MGTFLLLTGSRPEIQSMLAVFCNCVGTLGISSSLQPLMIWAAAISSARTMPGTSRVKGRKGGKQLKLNAGLARVLLLTSYGVEAPIRLWGAR